MVNTVGIEGVGSKPLAWPSHSVVKAASVHYTGVRIFVCVVESLP